MKLLVKILLSHKLLTILPVFLLLYGCKRVHERAIVDLKVIAYDVSIVDSIQGHLFYEWHAEVLLCNNSVDTIWVYESLGDNVLTCRFSYYYKNAGELTNAYFAPHTPMAEYVPLMPKQCKQYDVGFPLEKGNGATLDMRYILISPQFLSRQSQIQSISSELVDSLVENVLYRPIYPFEITSHSNIKIRPFFGDIPATLSVQNPR